MEDFFKPDQRVDGAKGLVFVGRKVIVYRRDNRTNLYPLCLDLPGGGLQDDETPFEAFKREVKEEFGLTIKSENIVYARRYESTIKSEHFGYFAVAKLPRSAAAHITFGDEGVAYWLMTPEEYLGRDDAWPVFQTRTTDYLKTLEG